MNQNLLRVGDIVAVQKSGVGYYQRDVRYDKAQVTELKVPERMSSSRPRRLRVKFFDEWDSENISDYESTIDSREVIDLWDNIQPEVEAALEKRNWRKQEDDRLRRVQDYVRGILDELQDELLMEEAEYGRLALNMNGNIIFSTAGTSLPSNEMYQSHRMAEFVHRLYEKLGHKDEDFRNLDFVPVPKPWEDN